MSTYDTTSAVKTWDRVAPQCDTCRFYLRQYCRRYPPIASAHNGPAAQPRVEYNDWCGEYSQRQKEQ